MKVNTIQFRRKCKIGNYEYDPKALIGVGFYGKVYKGIRLTDKLDIAIKVVDLNKHPDKEATKFIQNQLKINQIMNHEKVIHCLEIFKKNNIFYFVTEYFPQGDLQKYIKTCGLLSEYEAISILHQVIEALVYLKKKKVIHRDVKPANIFMKDGSIKLADFGLSVLVQSQPFSQQLRIGTPRYMSPEMSRQGLYSYNGDVWSLGSILIEMILGEAPLSKCETFQEITQKVIGPMIPQTLNVSVECQNLLQSIFQVNYEKRISIEDIYNHPVFQGLLKKQSSISTQDDSQIHIQDIENESLKQSSLPSRRDSLINQFDSNETSIEPNLRTTQLFQKFIKSLSKQNCALNSLNYIFQKLKETQKIKHTDLVYIHERIDQKIKQLQSYNNGNSQMQAIDLIYFKSLLNSKQEQINKKNDNLF